MCRYIDFIGIFTYICTMIAVITGDIIHSRSLKNQGEWQVPLKKLLNEIGRSPQTWQIFRGDSFQVEIKQVEKALYYAFRIKALIKKIKSIDVRMSIGIGTKDYTGDTVMESNGTAFIFSGEEYDLLKKHRTTMIIKSPWAAFNRDMNALLKLSLIIMDNWKTNAAELADLMLNNEQMNQVEIGNVLRIAQSSVSERQKRAYINEIIEVEQLFREKLKNYL